MNTPLRVRNALVILILFSLPAYSQIYKCNDNGQIVYLQKPCPADTKAQVFQEKKQLSIAGIKLGMKEEEAIEAITSYLKVDKKALIRTKERSYGEFAQQHRVIYTIEHSTGVYRFEVFPDVLNTKGTVTDPKLVFYVSQKLPINNRDRALEKVTQMYGKYYSHPHPDHYYWCYRCDRESLEREELKLEMYQTTLVLKDNKLQQAMFYFGRGYFDNWPK